jgi:hypothetical protein
MINLKHQNGYDLIEYIDKYTIANQIDEQINIYLDSDKSELDLIERLTFESIFMTKTLLVIDANSRKINAKVEVLIAESNYHIIIINSVHTKNIVQTPVFSDERKLKKLDQILIPDKYKERLIKLKDRFIFENEFEKARILGQDYKFEENILSEDEYNININFENSINNISEQQINNVIKFYKACWYFNSFPGEDDVTLGNKIGINPKVLYYYRKEYRKLNAKKAGNKIHEIIDWQILCRTQRINSKIQKILFKEIIQIKE